MTVETMILGAGITGLSAGVTTGKMIFEASPYPGGLCASYRIDAAGKKYFSDKEKSRGYRFEKGGGHWIFGADEQVLTFINSLSPVKSYQRQSSVYFPEQDLYVPYPLQNHLSYLPASLARKALNEICDLQPQPGDKFSDWLLVHFGPTLCELFFFPFHDLYTAGMYVQIAPQDPYKTPLDKNLIIKGFKDKTPLLGYNAAFVYPRKGLNDFIRKMSRRCSLRFKKKVIKVDIQRKKVIFGDGGEVKYEKLISTLPLNKMIDMCGVKLGFASPPYTSVQVVNIGARRGKKCPADHWLYIPQSQSGFYRVGFYSNVEPSFLPEAARKSPERVSIYVEKAFRGGRALSEEETQKLCASIVKELRDWEFIGEVEIVDPTWIEVAYTWEYPNSPWKVEALEILRQNNIFQAGRYGKWKFQGIAESIRDGFSIAV